jgi:hypothetical protein
MQLLLAHSRLNESGAFIPISRGSAIAPTALVKDEPWGSSNAASNQSVWEQVILQYRQLLLLLLLL